MTAKCTLVALSYVLFLGIAAVATEDHWDRVLIALAVEAEMEGKR